MKLTMETRIKKAIVYLILFAGIPYVMLAMFLYWIVTGKDSAVCLLNEFESWK